MREIYYNGVIDTGTGLDAEAMAVEDGRIAAVGSLRDVNHSEDTVFHDLEGRFVVPGFNDSHMHLLNYGHTLKLVDLTQATTSLEAMCLALSGYLLEESRPPARGS